MGQHPKGFINLLLLALCIGIIAAELFPAGQDYFYQGCLLAALVCTSALIMLYRTSNFTWLAFIILVCLLGAGRFYLASNITAGDILNQEGHKVQLTGHIEETPRIRRDDKGKLHVRYIVAVDGADDGSGENWHHAEGNIIVYANDNSYDGRYDEDESAENWERYGQSGDRIKVSGTVRALHDYGNPGRMNTVMTYMSQGIHAQMMADRYSVVIQPEEGEWLARISARVRNAYKADMEAVMPRQDAAAIFAMLFGGYQGIKPELLESFTATGIVHILSVSGSHITLMAGTASILGRLLHLSDKMTTILATVTILFYSLLAGAIPPVIRSALMGILTLMAMSLGRERDAQHILGLTAFGLLLYSPLLLFDISFQLSFGATAGLLYIAPLLRRALRKKLPVFVADSMAVTIGAQLSVLPVIAWYFNVISLSSLIANLIIAPIVEWIIVIGLLAGILASIIPVLGKFIFIVASLGLGLVYDMSRQVASLPGSQLYMPSFTWWSLTIYYSVLGWLILDENEKRYLNGYLGLNGRQVKSKFVIMGGVLVLAILVDSHIFTKNELQVHFIDVGQGDAALVITPHGHAFMVDTGGVREGGYDIGKMVDVPYLLHYGVRRLDYIFLTHAHDDHAAGVRGIVGKIPVKAIMIGHEGTGDYLRTFGKGDVARLEKLLVPLKENTSMELDGVRIEILYSPEAKDVMESNIQSTGNEFSNLIRISYGKASFLFTGDLVTEQEQELLSRKTPLRSTVLKVGHHGSHTSSSEKFLQAVNPGWAVISCGYANSFGHPHKEILERIEKFTSAKILRTDQCGAIVFRTDGDIMHIECFRE